MKGEKGNETDRKAQSERETGKCARNGGVGSGGRIRTGDLRVMSPTSYHCSTPR